MSISGITSSSIAAAYTPPPPVQQTQQSKAPQQAPKVDTVTISKQAQQLAKDGDAQAQESSETSAEKSSEILRGKA
jgi:hypothetical protein